MGMAKENRSWGYDRVGALANLGYRVSDQTVGNVLRRHGIARLDGANHRWRKNPPREMSIDLAADEQVPQHDRDQIMRLARLVDVTPAPDSRMLCGSNEGVNECDRVAITLGPPKASTPVVSVSMTISRMVRCRKKVRERAFVI